MRKTMMVFFGGCAMAAVMLGAIASRAAEVNEEVLSFDMWCLEMQYYAPARCDARQSGDVDQYKQYRNEVERYNDQQKDKQKRDQALLNKLNGGSGNPAQNAQDRAPN